MIKIITASTTEVDDPKLAVENILTQIDPENVLHKNSVGIMTCSTEFIETGVTEAVDKALPFDTLGMTTLANATDKDEGMDIFSISVYTSDDVEFSIGISSPIAQGNVSKPILEVYRETIKKLKNKAKLILPVGPLVQDVSGEEMIDLINNVAGEVPVFGSMSTSLRFDFDTTFVLFKGKAYERSLALLMMSGNISPRFVISTISDDRITKQKAIITDSDGSLLKEVNNLNFVEYMKTIGLSEGDGIEGSSAIPFVVDYKDGTKPSVRGIYSVNDEGHAFCGGNMPVGSTLAIGSLDPKDIVKTAGEAVREAMKIGDVNGILMFPCQGRNHLLEMDYLAEMNKVKEEVGNKVPYHLAYSGGEICPTYDDHGKTVNRFHNFTFITCVL